MTEIDEHTERFVHLRPLLFTIVYEILGSATDSDDVLQDSGGKVTALPELVMVGAERVGAILMAVFRYAQRHPNVRIEAVNCNGQPALACYIGDNLEALLVFEIADDKIINGYGIRNPDKLAALGIPRVISRTTTPRP